MPENHVDIVLKAAVDQAVGQFMQASKSIESAINSMAKSNVASLEKLNKTIDQTGESFQKSTNSMLSDAKRLIGAYVGIQQAWEAINLAARFQSIAASFSTMTAQVGINGGQLLKRMQETSRGTVDAIDLMKSANLALGAAFKQDEIVKFLELSTKIAAARGEAIKDVYERLIGVIATGEQNLVDQYGLQKDLNLIYGEYGRIINKTAEEVRKYYSQEAMKHHILSDGPQIFKNINTAASEYMQTIQRLQVSISDFKTRVGQGLLGIIGIVNTLAEALGLAAFRVVTFLEHPIDYARGKFDKILAEEEARIKKFMDASNEMVTKAFTGENMGVPAAAEGIFNTKTYADQFRKLNDTLAIQLAEGAKKNKEAAEKAAKEGIAAVKREATQAANEIKRAQDAALNFYESIIVKSKEAIDPMAQLQAKFDEVKNWLTKTQIEQIEDFLNTERVAAFTKEFEKLNDTLKNALQDGVKSFADGMEKALEKMNRDLLAALQTARQMKIDLTSIGLGSLKGVLDEMKKMGTVKGFNEGRANIASIGAQGIGAASSVLATSFGIPPEFAGILGQAVTQGLEMAFGASGLLKSGFADALIQGGLLLKNAFAFLRPWLDLTGAILKAIAQFLEPINKAMSSLLDVIKPGFDLITRILEAILTALDPTKWFSKDNAKTAGRVGAAVLTGGISELFWKGSSNGSNVSAFSRSSNVVAFAPRSTSSFSSPSPAVSRESSFSMAMAAGKPIVINIQAMDARSFRDWANQRDMQMAIKKLVGS